MPTMIMLKDVFIYTKVGILVHDTLQVAVYYLTKAVWDHEYLTYDVCCGGTLDLLDEDRWFLIACPRLFHREQLGCPGRYGGRWREHICPCGRSVRSSSRLVLVSVGGPLCHAQRPCDRYNLAVYLIWDTFILSFTWPYLDRRIPLSLTVSCT